MGSVSRSLLRRRQDERTVKRRTGKPCYVKGRDRPFALSGPARADHHHGPEKISNERPDTFTQTAPSSKKLLLQSRGGPYIRVSCEFALFTVQTRNYSGEAHRN